MHKILEPALQMELGACFVLVKGAGLGVLRRYCYRLLRRIFASTEYRPGPVRMNMKKITK
jgi:hypothetical protein